VNGPPNITFGMDTFMKPRAPSRPNTVRLRLLETCLNCKSEIVESLVVPTTKGESPSVVKKLRAGGRVYVVFKQSFLS